MIYGELGRYPLDIDIKLRNILYWAKLITGKDIKLSIISYRLLYLSQNGKCQFSWLNYAENILNECGLSYVWLNQYFISEEWLKTPLKLVSKISFNKPGMQILIPALKL
jgi:hypothetical protein